MARRKDGVDEEYRDQYRKWAGRTYKGKHPSHLVQGEKKRFSTQPADPRVLPIMSYDELNTDRL